MVDVDGRGYQVGACANKRYKQTLFSISTNVVLGQFGTILFWFCARPTWLIQQAHPVSFFNESITLHEALQNTENTTTFSIHCFLVERSATLSENVPSSTSSSVLEHVMAIPRIGSYHQSVISSSIVTHQDCSVRQISWRKLRLNQ